MWIGARIVIGRTADASRVQNQGASWQVDQVLLVTVTTEDNTGVNISQSLLDSGQWCPNKPTRCVAKLVEIDAAVISSGVTLSDHAARSMHRIVGFSASVCHPSTLRMVI